MVRFRRPALIRVYSFCCAQPVIIPRCLSLTRRQCAPGLVLTTLDGRSAEMLSDSLIGWPGLQARRPLSACTARPN